VAQNLLAESLRMYPAPPLLIRRALEADEWPAGGTGVKVKVDKASDLFISLYNMGRSPQIWDRCGATRARRLISLCV
jgi:cytochrome P450